MLMKARTRNKLFDRLHFGAVTTCMGITVLSMIGLGYYGYVYYSFIKPQQKLERLKIINEGANDRDAAPTVTP